jgi:FixJ family two-component response regulator
MLLEKSKSIPTKDRRIPKNPILIVEDALDNREIIIDVLKELNVPFESTINGEEALKLCQQKEYSIFIIDLVMPVMDGLTFLQELKKINPEPVVIVQSGTEDQGMIINIMKLGVYEFIRKPLHRETLTLVVEKCLEHKYLLEAEKRLIHTESRDLRNELEWLSYKEAKRKLGRDSADRNSIYNLMTSLSQGSGFGSQTTAIDLLEMIKEDLDETTYKIDKETVDILIENNHITKQLLKGLRNSLDILDKDSSLKKIRGITLNEKIPGMIKPITDEFYRKNLKISYPIFKNHLFLEIDEEMLAMALQELLLNALKYAPQNSNVDIFTHISEGYYCISVKNEVSSSPYNGIPKDLEKIVLKPFFRILPPVESLAHLENFGLGLGLTVVDNIISKHHGIFFVHDAKDHTTESVSLCVIAEIFLPIKKLAS